MALYPTRYGLRACRWIPHFSVYLIPFGGTHTFRRKPHFLALPPESTIRDPTEAPKTCSDTRFHARSAPCQKHNKPLEFLVLPSKTRNPRGPVRTHTFGIKMSVLVERATGIEPASEAWEASILPMNYARNSSPLATGLIIPEVKHTGQPRRQTKRGGTLSHKESRPSS